MGLGRVQGEGVTHRVLGWVVRGGRKSVLGGSSRDPSVIPWFLTKASADGLGLP